jgi:hypothetical protein
MTPYERARIRFLKRVIERGGRLLAEDHQMIKEVRAELKRMNLELQALDISLTLANSNV